MANKIAVPKLGSQITPLRVAEIDIDDNPYRSVVGATAELKAVVERDALDLP